MKTLKACLIGEKIKHSVSPAIYNFFANELSFNIDYTLVDISRSGLGEFVKSARESLTGFNITMPHKQNIIEHLDFLDPSVSECGACNLVKIDNHKLTGFNTDGDGVVLALFLNCFLVKSKNILIIGAGGAAKSIVKSLEKNGAGKITILNRTKENARALCENVNVRAEFDALNDITLKKHIQNSDLLINASTLGQIGYDDFDSLSFMDTALNLVVFDINYSNPKSRLWLSAKEKGIKYLNGKWMVACQAVKVLDIWLGILPDDKTILKLVNSL